MRIHEAAAAGDVEAVRQILADDPDQVKARDEQGNLPLHHAALANRWPQPEHVEVARLLVQHGAYVDALGFHDRAGEISPLIFAAMGGYKNVEMVRFLVENGADPDYQSSNGLTPLLAGAMEGADEVCHQLMEMGAQLDLHSAAALGMRDRIRKALRSDPELVDSRDPYLNAQPLFFAAMRDRKEVAALLLSFGADLGADNREGNTAMHAAAAAGSRRTLEFLIEEGADVNRRNHNIQTPLHWAVEEWNTEGSEIIKMLIEHGADINARDAGKVTPLGKAVARNKTHLVEILKKHRARE